MAQHRMVASHHHNHVPSHPSHGPASSVTLLHLRAQRAGAPAAVRHQHVGLAEGRPHVPQRVVHHSQTLVLAVTRLQHLCDGVHDVDRGVQAELPPLQHHHRHHRHHDVGVYGHVVALHRLEDGAHALARAGSGLRELADGAGDLVLKQRQVKRGAHVAAEAHDLVGHAHPVPVDDGLEELRQGGLVRRGQLGGQTRVQDHDLGSRREP
mmetsp:Transcript_21238/g.52763  ORF Transcript_21238/g.52763 Transcript_21238/m.52763 type:complete len:209 (-) Transcript_21238:65-691(-)|eukprot:CAMPEP_0197591402 /NCGR_PEP_ID=MMETSP1326-20131121/13110_1 /TAXON_ID=1155430 /ORGANISM="Genus nov. species nov., Strain RCC2288" /LENGTH=208 /DNA_ID=CAMNT_0043156827 /DNA_START=258 /DNA_END=884 /DNA_ORIENTATION=+